VGKSYKHSETISHLDVEHGRILYSVDFRNVKYPRLEINGASLSLILPEDRKDHKKIIDKKRKWITKKYKRINKILEANKGLNKNLIIFGRPVKIINSDSKIKYLNGKIYIDTKDLSKVRGFLKRVLKEKLVELTKKTFEATQCRL